MNITIREFLKRPIAYQPIIAKAFDSVTLAIFWCQLLYWEDKTNDPDGWIRKSRKEIFDETALSRRQQETARNIGEKLGVLEGERIGKLGIMHFRINIDKAIEIIEEYTKNNPTKERNNLLGAIERPTPQQKQEKALLPEWLNKEAWNNWEQHRKEIKRKLTPSTIIQQLNFLERYKRDHIEIINTSILNGWTGLFPISKKYNKDNYQQEKGKLETIILQDGTETSVIIEKGQTLESVKKEILNRYNPNT